MTAKDQGGVQTLSLVPKGGQGPADFQGKDLESFTERRVRKEDRRQGNDRRSLIRFEPGKDADRRSLQGRRRADGAWNGCGI